MLDESPRAGIIALSLLIVLLSFFWARLTRNLLGNYQRYLAAVIFSVSVMLIFVVQKIFYLQIAGPDATDPDPIWLLNLAIQTVICIICIWQVLLKRRF